MEARNAVIKSARLCTDDRNLLSAWLDLDYSGSGQGFGGYALYLPTSFTHHNPSGPNFAGHFIWRVMEIAGVTEWSVLSGRTIRVKQEHSAVHAIGHVIKDDWFCPSLDFELMQKSAQAREVTSHE